MTTEAPFNCPCVWAPRCHVGTKSNRRKETRQSENSRQEMAYRGRRSVNGTATTVVHLCAYDFLAYKPTYPNITSSSHPRQPHRHRARAPETVTSEAKLNRETFRHLGRTSQSHTMKRFHHPTCSGASVECRRETCDH